MSYLFLFILGLAVGSFLNVLIDRLPNEESIGGRSRCDECLTKLAWNDLIPVLSYVKLRGKCRYCKMNLSWQYPFIELFTGLVFVVVGSMSPLSLEPAYASGNISINQSLLSLHTSFLRMAAYLGIVSTAIVIFFSDLKYHIIPDSMQILLFAFSFLLVVSFGLTPQLFLDHVIGAFVVITPILFLFLITKGRGMGFGDVKLAFSMGFLLGPLGGLTALYIAFVGGAVVGICLRIAGKRGWKSKIAFGPFLIIGLITMLWWGERILEIVKGLYGV